MSEILKGGAWVAFSYEDIFELLRAEKYSADLQPLKPEDIAKIREYFKLKEELLKRQSASPIFMRAQQDKIQTEIENAWRALRDLYERRERKLINRALFSSRTAFKMKDSENMLESEARIYEQLLELLKKNCIEFFENFEIKVKFEGEHPAEVKTAAKAEAKALKEGSEKKTEESHVETDAGSDTEELREIKKLKLLRFIEPVDELVDLELNTYGPFEKEDVAALPQELADLLIKQKKVEEIMNEAG